MEAVQHSDREWSGLRRDLLVYAGPAEKDGSETWVIEDPLSGHMFRFGEMEGALIFQLFNSNTVEEAYHRLIQTTSFRPAQAEVVQFVRSLAEAGLAIGSKARLRPGEEEETEDGGLLNAMGPGPLLKKVLHGYIYFRIRLWRPDHFLTHAYPWVRWLWSPWMRALYVLIGVLGVLLTLQQIEAFGDRVSRLFTPAGIVGFTLTLVALKIGHELAHGFASKSGNLHVRAMGVAFIVLWPILFTDTTDAWSSRSRGLRVRIDAAGVLFELAVGGIALFCWALMPNGALRDLMFYLSSTSIASTLFVNINPFMRFDGYYLLMDAWGIDNLQPRAFALLQYRLRRLLLAWKSGPPENHPHEGRMIIYALFTMAYRVMIAISIALAVYHLFSREIGVFLAIIEVWIFLLRPIWVFIHAAWEHRELIGSRARAALSGVALAGLCGGLFVPISFYEETPALLRFAQARPITATAVGRLVQFPDEVGVELPVGAVAAALEDDSLYQELNDSLLEREIKTERMKALGNSGEEGGYRQWYEAEIKRIDAAVEKLRQGIAQQRIIAERPSRVRELNEELRIGDHVKEGAWLMTLEGSDELQCLVFIREDQMPKLRGWIDHDQGLRVELLPWDIHLPDMNGRIKEVREFPSRLQEYPMLLDVAGGPVPSTLAGEHHAAIEPWFALLVELEGPAAPHLHHQTPAWARLRLPPESLFDRGLRLAAELFYRT